MPSWRAAITQKRLGFLEGRGNTAPFRGLLAAYRVSGSPVGEKNDCGLQTGPESLGTKDRCDQSSPRKNVLWLAASESCATSKAPRWHLLRSRGLPLVRWAREHGTLSSRGSWHLVWLWFQTCVRKMPLLMFTRRALVLEVSTHRGAAAA